MDKHWLSFRLNTELPGEGEYEVEGRMGYNTQTGQYQTVNWNNRKQMYTYRGYWKENNVLAYQLVYSKQINEIKIYYRKKSDREIHKWLEMKGADGNIKTGYEMRFTKATVANNEQL